MGMAAAAIQWNGKRLGDVFARMPVAVPGEIPEALRPEADRATRELRHVIAQAIPRAERLVIDNAAAYWAENSKDAWTSDEMPSMNLPFPLCWIEFKLPAKLNAGGKTIDWPMGGGMCGVWSVRYDVKDGRVIGQPAGELSRLIPKYNRFGEARFVLAHHIFSAYGGGLMLMGSWIDYIDTDGGMVGEGFYLNSFADDVGQRMHDSCYLLLTPVRLGLAFINSKNVAAVQVDPPPALSAKRLKREGVPLLKYKVLVIDRGDDRTPSNGSGNPADLPLHICRGHFKRYTSERPLFGRYVGNVWCPQHMRGDAAHGQVIKDYELGDKR